MYNPWSSLEITPERRLGMKHLAVVIFLTLSNVALAGPCKVYGISDSPQKLDCTFPTFTIELRCKSGNYYLNSSKVSTAYHEEVEEGPVPLVFKSPEMDLTVLVQEKANIEAIVEKKGKTFMGSCL